MNITITTKIKGFEKVVFFSNSNRSVNGVVAIHNTSCGPALGGCRINTYPNLLHCVNDALALAKAMTYKNAIVKLPFGGGKAVIHQNPNVNKESCLLIFAEVLNQLKGEYITTDDVGTCILDMDYLRRFSPYAKGILYNGKQISATAYGVFQAIKAAVYFKEGKHDLTGLEVIVQGLGKVGYPLCHYLHHAGCKLFVFDPITKLVDQAVKEFRAIPILLNHDVDIKADVFSPCALGGIINHKNKNNFKVKYIVGGANNQLEDMHLAEYLHRKDIVYVPDYLSNSGGVIDIHCENEYSEKNVFDSISVIYHRVIEVLQKSLELARNPLEIADQLVNYQLEKKL